MRPPSIRRQWCRLRFLILTVAFLAGGTSRGLDPDKTMDEYVHEVWTTAEGLPQNTINDIVQTRDGYLWVATFGGLARFDGVRFTVFDVSTAPGLGSNRLTALHEDGAGVLWAGSEPGLLSRYEGGRFTTLGTRDDLPPGGVIWDIESDGDVLWLGTSLGLVRLRNGAFTVYTSDDGLGDDSVTAVVRGRGGEIWAGTGKGLARWADGSFEVYPLPAAARDQPVYALTQDRAGRLWLGLQDGLAELAGGEVWLRFEAPSSWDFLGSILEDRSGSLWYSTRGLSRCNGGVGAAPERFLTGETIRSLYEDREGNVWIGTTLGGLHQLRDAVFESYVDLDGHASTAIAEGEKGDILIGKLCAGLVRFRDETLSPVPLPDRRFDCVRSLLLDREGALWVGALNLARRSGGAWSVYTSVDGVPEDVNALYEDRRGRVWAGTVSGLVSLVGGRPQRLYTAHDGLPSDDVRFIIEGRRGDLWIATPNGLARFTGGEISPAAARLYTTDHGLPYNSVRAIHEDERGVLWIGTYGGGLARLEDDVFTAITARDGLRENVVSRVLEDEHGNLWMSGNRGITRLRRAEADAFARGEAERVNAVLYDADDGMTVSETNGGFQPAGTKASDGRLWFPTIRGAVVVDPEKIRAAVAPPVAIERVRVGREDVDFSERVTVPPGGWDLEVEYTGLRLGLPDEMEFRYRLVGHDDAWVEVGRRRTAYYTRVPHGRYRFEVTAAAHAGGAWNEKAASFEIVFEPFFFETRWFQVVVALAAAALLGVTVSWRLSRARRRAQDLEAVNVELERTVTELEAKNAEMERFTYTVSHDLKTPLVTILGFLGLARQDATHGDRERLDKDLERINSAALTMSRLLNDLLELSRIGLVMNTPKSVELTELVCEAAALAASRLDGVEVEIAEDLPVVVGDRPRLLEIFQNLLDNAARFMGDEPRRRIEVARRRDRDGDVIFVRDNGMGIEPRYHERVFGLFERLDSTTEGTGVGLALVKRIVEFHGGRVWVESQGRGHGSTFCLTLPGAPTVS